MQTRITRKLLSDLTSEEFAQCYALNLGSAGLMRRRLVWEEKQEEVTAYAVMLREVGTKQLIGWCLLFKDQYHRWDCYYYVSPGARRMGFGTKLTNYIKRITFISEFAVHPHDVGSSAFFRSVGGAAGKIKV